MQQIITRIGFSQSAVNCVNKGNIFTALDSKMWCCRRMRSIAGHPLMYTVQATSSDRNTGVLAAEVGSSRAAMKSARHLRNQGFEVTITGPDGKPVDETAEPSDERSV
jgi:biotin operon repressor